MSDAFAILSSDLTEQILSHLPIRSLLQASLTCKLFLSLVSSPTFPSSPSPWFFLYGLHNTSSKNNQSFAFDPSSNSWFRLPPPTSLLDNFSASNGFLFSTTSASSFSFSPVLKLNWTTSPPLRFPRRNPLLGVFCPSASNPSTPSFIVVGGVRFIGGLVDIEERLAVEIYDPETNSWDLCPPLPHDFPFGYSSQTLSSALFKNKFYVLGIYSYFVSSFDLKTRSWGPVLTLRPPGVTFSFLVACNGMLVLAGMCNGPHLGLSFNLWKVDEATMEFSEIAVMPQELLYGLGDIEEEFASVKCVGMGNLVYVFNEDYHKRYPACVCELGVSSSRWRKVPPLPSSVNKFHKVISFCSVISLHDIFQEHAPVNDTAGSTAFRQQASLL